MWRHTLNVHNGVNGGIGDYKMEVKKSFKEPLSRVIEEAVRIQEADRNPKVECLKSRHEYFRSEYVRPAFFKGLSDQ